MIENLKDDRSLRSPQILLPYQERWISDQATVKIWEKGRRIGATWCEASEDVLLAASSAAAGGMDVFYIGQTLEDGREFIEDCADWARHYELAASKIDEVIFKDEDKDILAYRISFASGFKILALSSAPRRIRGKQGKIIIDEGAHQDDLQELIDAAIAMLIWGGKVVIISTHFGESNPFNDLIRDCREGKFDYSVHRTTFDDAIAEGLYERICLRGKKDYTKEGEKQFRAEIYKQYGDAVDQELGCVPAKGSGLFLARHLIEACMDADIPVLRIARASEFAELPESSRKAEIEDWCDDELAPLLAVMPQGYPTFFGEDFGRSGDLTVILPLQEQPDLTYRAPFVAELRNIPFENQKQILFYIVDRLPRFRGGALDARGNGQYLAEVAMQRYGSSRIAQAMLSQPFYLENAPRYKAAFEDRAIMLPKDADVLDDHRAFRMEKGIAKIPDRYEGKGRDGGKRHGDAGIAGLLAWYAVRNVDGSPAEISSRGTRETSDMLRGYDDDSVGGRWRQ